MVDGMILSFLSVSKPKYCSLFNCKVFEFGLHFLSAIKSNQIIKYNFLQTKKLRQKAYVSRINKKSCEIVINTMYMSILQIFISQRIFLYEKRI